MGMAGQASHRVVAHVVCKGKTVGWVGLGAAVHRADDWVVAERVLIHRDRLADPVAHRAADFQVGHSHRDSGNPDTWDNAAALTVLLRSSTKGCQGPGAV